MVNDFFILGELPQTSLAGPPIDPLIYHVNLKNILFCLTNGPSPIEYALFKEFWHLYYNI